VGQQRKRTKACPLQSVVTLSLPPTPTNQHSPPHPPSPKTAILKKHNTLSSSPSLTFLFFKKKKP